MTKPIRDPSPLGGSEQVLVNKINWTIGRQNITVAILLSSVVGSFAALRIDVPGYPLIYALFVLAVLFEFWWIFNFEQTILQYHFALEEIRLDWTVPKDTPVWAWFKPDGYINYLYFIPTEILIIIGFVTAFFILRAPLL